MKKTSKKTTVLMAVAAALALVGCSGQGAGTTASAAPGAGSTEAAGAAGAAGPEAAVGTSAPADAVELELLLSDDTLEGGAMAAMVAKFNEAYKGQGIQVKINEVAYADIDTQILNRASVNDMPALIRTVRFAQYADYLYPLNESGFNQEDFYLPGSTGGNFYAASINATAVGMIINKTAFDNAGVAYPTTEEERWTWDEFVTAVKEVQAANENIQAGLVMDHSQQRSGNVLYQFGMQYYDKADHTKLNMRSADTKAGLEFILAMYQPDGISMPSVGVGTENPQDVFKTGTVAAHLSGNWVVNDYRANIKDFEWLPVLMPYAKEKATSLGGNYLMVPQTDYTQQAMVFMDWFYQPENYEEYCSLGNYLPGKRGMEPTYTYDGLSTFTEEMDASIDQPNYDYGVGVEFYASETWGNALRDALDRAIAGEMDADGVIDYVVTEQLNNLTGTHE